MGDSGRCIEANGTEGGVCLNDKGPKTSSVRHESTFRSILGVECVRTHARS